MSLTEFKARRDFRKTKEPSGAEEGGRAELFVIQKHDARNLHYDFRISVDGVLVSWAVPKGPSTDPREKRLAIRTEDHPLSYAEFEGVIPEGEYGAGTVMVWDRGTYENLNEDERVAEGLENGHIKINLKGEKLKGGYALTETNSEKNWWILVKTRDDAADARSNPTSTRPRSVLTGRTLKEIQEEEGT
ncbi:MAG TPA: DNA ligase [Methanomicrobia archaeon]|nr:DNA ligase [Methanomicrobia archaeon]